MNPQSIRWQQRFDNFEHAYELLEKYVGIEMPGELERAALSSFLKWQSN